MQVQWALGVRDFDDSEGAPLVLVGLGADTSPVLRLPCPGAWLKAVACISIEYDEIIEGSVLSMVWEVHDPENETCGAGSVDMPIRERSQWHRPGWLGHHVQPVVIEFDATTAGAYPIVFRLRGSDSEPCVLIHYVALRSDLP
jgi:hypothetical protein